MKVQAVRFHATGGPVVLQLDELDLPEPGTGEVRIRHTAIGLNFQDIYARSGADPSPLPSGLGTEAVGVVEVVGVGVADFKIGDRVCYASGPVLGACATHRNYPAARLLHAPADMKDEEIAAVLLKGMTVEYLMQRCYPVQAGQFVLMHAAAGGVGLLAGQWGLALGAQMFVGARISCKYIASVLANEVITAHGVVTGKVPKGDGYRFTVEVWCDNEAGEKKTVGFVEVDVGVSLVAA